MDKKTFEKVIKKAHALDCMVKRGDISLKDAVLILEEEYPREGHKKEKDAVNNEKL